MKTPDMLWEIIEQNDARILSCVSARSAHSVSVRSALCLWLAACFVPVGRACTTCNLWFRSATSGFRNYHSNDHKRSHVSLLILVGCLEVHWVPLGCFRTWYRSTTILKTVRGRGKWHGKVRKQFFRPHWHPKWLGWKIVAANDPKMRCFRALLGT